MVTVLVSEQIVSIVRRNELEGSREAHFDEGSVVYLHGIVVSVQIVVGLHLLPNEYTRRFQRSCYPYYIRRGYMVPSGPRWMCN